MTTSEFDLLTIERGLVIAPAGCGKTQLIANALRNHKFAKPILVLTHTNSGVAALRGRLDKAGVKPSAYRLSTIDGCAIRLISTFPLRSRYDPKIIEGQRPNYSAIRDAAWKLLKAGHVNDVVTASYSRLLVDEYQDCSLRQHGIVYYAATILPTCVVGDPVQAIFGFGDDALADWQEHVCKHFALAGELTHPWRWANAGAEELGRWLLEVRQKLLAKQPVDLRTAPAAVTWIQLDGTKNDYPKLLEAGKVKPPDNVGSVLIVGESTNPASQQKFASETPGAVTVEAVDLRDLVTFARNLDIDAPNALQTIAQFASNVMTNVGPDDLLHRVDTIMRGAARKDPSDVERAAVAFQSDRTHEKVLDLLVELNKDFGVRVYRPPVFRACLRALELCCGPEKSTFLDAAIRMREQNRVLGRSLPRRAVGSTLLLKGLEAEVVVILNADSLNARNLYVAMTRGSKRTIICGRNPVLTPIW
jgi:hypothetical protein